MPRKEVPANFNDLMERYPLYVAHIVRRFLRYSMTTERAFHDINVCTWFEADIEEYVQDVLLHLMALAPDSEYRELGFKDRIEIYDDSLCPSNRTPLDHFFRYLTSIVRRYLMTTLAHRNIDALSHPKVPLGWVSIHPEARMNRNLLIKEVCGYVNEVAEFSSKQPVNKGKDWERLSKNLRISSKYSVRLRVNKYLDKHGRHHFFSIKGIEADLTTGEAHENRNTVHPDAHR